MRWQPSLRLAVPLAIVVSAAIAALVALSVGLVLARSTAIEESVQRNRARLSTRQAVLEAALRRGDLVFLDEVVAGLGVDSTVARAVVVGDDDVVMASTRRAELGRPLEPMSELMPLVAAARARTGPQHQVVTPEDQVLGSIVLGRRSTSPGPSAVLVIEHDASTAVAALQRTVKIATAAFVGLLLVVAAVVGQLFGARITRRANQVLEAAGRIAGGDFDARTGLTGDDELGRIGRAVDDLASQLESRRRESAQSEQRWRLVFEQAADPIFVSTPDGRYEDANAAAFELLGFSRDELLTKHLQDLIPPEDAPSRPLALAELRARRTLSTRRRLLARSGERIPVEITASVLSDGRLLGVVRDLRPRLEADRLRAQVAANEQLAVLGTLAASVGHELNNPLTWLLSGLEHALAQAQREAPGAETLLQSLQEAKDGAERVTRIVADLRVFGRTEPLETRRPVDLASVVRTAANLCTPAMRERTSIVLELPPMPKVWAEERRLGQVILNLLTNAVHAMPADRPVQANRVRLSTRAEGEEVVLEVADNGQGIAPEVLPRIFEPYFTTKPPSLGTGLGLSICQDFVSRFGGRLTVDSTLGEGTTFAVRLPVAQDAPVRDETKPGLVGAGTEHPRRVLIVDDEPMVARTLSRLLQGHVVTVVDSPGAALDACSASDFDRIFCDLSMPGGGGKAFFDGLATVKPDLQARVVFVTGGAATAEAAAFLESTHRPVLYKPFAASRVLELLG